MSSATDKPVFAFEGGHVREVYVTANNYVSTHFAALDAPLLPVNFGLWEDWRYPISNGHCMKSLSKAQRATDPRQ